MHSKKLSSRLKIYFYSPGIGSPVPDKDTGSTSGGVFMNPTPLYFDSYVKQNSLEIYDLYEWTKIQYLYITQDQLIKEINELDIDVLAVSLYIWNKPNVLAAIKDLNKKIKKPVKIIMGGPSVDVVRNSTFLQNLPDVDFAIYAQGEIPFISIIKHYAGLQKISVLNTKNVAWLDDGKLKKADYEFIRVKSGSPITENLDLLQQIVAEPTLQGIDLYYPYETSRGCPYGCSFCDWTSGLSHKTQKRKFNYPEELKALGELGIVNLYLSDANFGLWSEDVETAKEIARLKKEKKYNFQIHGFNFSKTKKDRVYEIVDIFLEAKLLPYMKVSIQDMNEHVLKNIDRPDIPYEEHLKYIKEIQRKFPDTTLAFEIIKGLPGQTRELWDRMFDESAEHNVQLRIYDWEMIPNSPAGYDKEYQEKMQLKTVIAVDPSWNNSFTEDVVETYSYNRKDYAYFTLTYLIYELYFRNFVKEYPKFLKLMKQVTFFDETLDNIVNSLTDKSIVKHIAYSFMQRIIKENVKLFDKEFLKVIYNRLKAQQGHHEVSGLHSILEIQETQRVLNKVKVFAQ